MYRKLVQFLDASRAIRRRFFTRRLFYREAGIDNRKREKFNVGLAIAKMLAEGGIRKYNRHTYEILPRYE
jgi:hypothetical protein